MSKDNNIHSGHRQRVRERFCETGLDSFADHNVLELVLFYSLPRKDTNGIAHRLLESFGSLSAVFEASVERLMEVPGITYNSAVLIHLFNEVARRYAISKMDDGIALSDTETAAKYAAGLFMGMGEEALYIICLDGRNRVICCELHSKGTVDTTEVCVRRVIDSAVKHRASKVILAHNHPAAALRPSQSDVETTKKIELLLDNMNIALADHIIVGGNGKCLSMRELGIME